MKNILVQRHTTYKFINERVISLRENVKTIFVINTNKVILKKTHTED